MCIYMCIVYYHPTSAGGSLEQRMKLSPASDLMPSQSSLNFDFKLIMCCLY